jgi:ABC-type enterobactin transport system permease subunit
LSYHRYRIVVSGVLGAAACEAFEGFKIEQVRGDTVLRAELDQAALHGALNRVFALALELVDLTRED